MIPPIRKILTVPLTTDQAFDLFTDGIDQWWPVDSHSLSAGRGETPLDVKLEPRTGGKIIETLPDGSVTPWANVTTYEPGAKLVLSWYVGRDEDEATEVTVLFYPTDKGTRVELIHAGFDALADQGDTMAGHYLTGWDHVLGKLGRLCYPVAA